MQIVQTSWACNQKDLLRFNGGWYAPEYNLMAWSLSCLQLTKFHEKVVLHTDSTTAKMFIDKLKLPYSEVICDLDHYNEYPPELWALPKIHTYSQQKNSFLHVDGDVFIWKALNNSLLKGDLIAQNKEIGTSRYKKSFSELETHLSYITPEIEKERKKEQNMFAYNAGIIGGNDLNFFEIYTTKARELINKNLHNLSKISIAVFNIYFEQYLFYCLTQTENKIVSVLIDEIIPENTYSGFGNFMEVPYHKQYLHLIGRLYKWNHNVCQQMADRLRMDHPEYYYRIISLFKHNYAPLKKDYYHFIENFDEPNLIKRYLNLKIENQCPESLSLLNDNVNLYFDVKIDSKILENISYVIKEINSGQGTIVNSDKIFREAQLFENQLKSILEIKFPQYSFNSLYARDIKYTSYLERIFADTVTGFDKPIVADKNFEIIECSANWKAFDVEVINVNKALAYLTNFPSTVYLSVVPECDRKGYSLIQLDELDIQILKILENPVTINGILSIIKLSFDSEDVKESSLEFEILILGRVKQLFLSKMVKIV